MLINLLPHRSWAQGRQRKKVATGLAAAALLGLAFAVVAGVWFDQQISAQQLANSRLKQDIVGVDGRLKQIAQMEEKLLKLRARASTLQSLQDERQWPALWLHEVLDHLPDGLYLTALKQEGDKVTVNGMARSDEQVFALLKNIASQGRWLAQAELIEVTAAPVSADTLALAATPFALRALLQRPAETTAEKAALAAINAAASCLPRTLASSQNVC
jgi:type IV pilus assembly protein PilN